MNKTVNVHDGQPKDVYGVDTRLIFIALIGNDEDLRLWDDRQLRMPAERMAYSHADL